jgi:hypothetical protein
MGDGFGGAFDALRLVAAAFEETLEGATGVAGIVDDQDHLHPFPRADRSVQSAGGLIKKAHFPAATVTVGISFTGPISPDGSRGESFS